MKMHLSVASELEKAAQAGLKKAGRQILRRARELSPTNDGDSDKSGFSVVDDLTLQVGFKSYISRIQHEDLDYQHKPGEQAKFLEAAAEEIDTGAIIATEVRGTFG
ncbi:MULTISPECIES: hypothetical protein [Cryobacterium]|uniref:hypothetical protein n=1 Tax=Cryobacterium TaxID=69578 RepID=UPI000CD47D58|nr:MULTISPECIES: hypothetical protein [Cryobacterium]POH63632.1 hypothetical protein C3B60_16080 [Cryobacterium zongtaii]TFC45579.1 hypothetical protein E3O57_08005 [Cryobacterium sp. TMN-39-2]